MIFLYYFFFLSVSLRSNSFCMKRENLHQPFEILFSELDESTLKEHDHTFFELVYILTGTGIQWINNHKFPYHDGHLFMITPGDIHAFDIHTKTKFVYIKFNDIYIHSAVFGADNIQRLEFILQHANHQPGCILRNITDKLLVKPMIEAIIREYANKHFMQQYILNYKMKMVESRLLHTDMRINEIVEELGFTDESHLNRLFRKYKGISPTEFRKQNQHM